MKFKTITSTVTSHISFYTLYDFLKKYDIIWNNDNITKIL